MQSFIDKKSSQLVMHMNGFWYDNLPYKTLEAFLWDTLEEWSAIEQKDTQIYTHKERIFWHLFHETQFVTAATLQNDKVLKQEIAYCLEYLQNNRPCPLDVVGMRP